MKEPQLYKYLHLYGIWENFINKTTFLVAAFENDILSEKSVL